MSPAKSLAGAIVVSYAFRSPEALKQSSPPIWVNFLVPVNTILLNLFMATWLGSKADCEEINAWVESEMLLGKPASLLKPPWSILLSRLQTSLSIWLFKPFPKSWSKFKPRYDTPPSLWHLLLPWVSWWHSLLHHTDSDPNSPTESSSLGLQLPF